MSKDLITDVSVSIRAQYSSSNGSSVKKVDKTFTRELQLLLGKGLNQGDVFQILEATIAPLTTSSTSLNTASNDLLGIASEPRTYKLAVFEVDDNSAQKGVQVKNLGPRFVFDDTNAGLFTVRPGGFVILCAPDARAYDMDISPIAIGLTFFNMDPTVAQTIRCYLVGANIRDK